MSRIQVGRDVGRTALGPNQERRQGTVMRLDDSHFDQACDELGVHVVINLA